MKGNMIFHLVYGIFSLIMSIWIGIEYDWSTLFSLWCYLIALWLPLPLTPMVVFSIMEKNFKRKLPLITFAIILLLLIHLFMFNNAQSKYILMMNVLFVLGAIIRIAYLKNRR